MHSLKQTNYIKYDAVNSLPNLNLKTDTIE